MITTEKNVSGIAIDPALLHRIERLGEWADRPTEALIGQAVQEFLDRLEPLANANGVGDGSYTRGGNGASPSMADAKNIEVVWDEDDERLMQFFRRQRSQILREEGPY